MSPAIAEVIVADLPWKPEVFSAKFVVAFKRDQREVYDQTVYDSAQHDHAATDAGQTHGSPNSLRDPSRRR